MSVIEKILKLMEEKRITARKLTTELELANSSISEWKKGKAKPSLEAVVKIAKYFGVTTDYLLLDNFEGSANVQTMTMAQQMDEREVPSDTADSDDRDEDSVEDRLQSCNEGICIYVELSSEEKRMLDCYQTLDEEDKEYIRCKMIVLKRESIV